MRPFGGTQYIIQMDGSNAGGHLQWELNAALKNAGWLPKLWSASRINLSIGVSVLTVAPRNHPVNSEAAEALADWLDRSGIAVLALPIDNSLMELGTLVIQIGPRPETVEQY